MTALPQDPDAAQRWADALTVLALFAIDPVGTVGIRLKAHAGPVRARWLQLFQGALGADQPIRKVPHGITDGRLLGGLDLAATLAAGRPVAERGLLAEADGGILTVAMAERLAPGTAALIASSLDSGSVAVERDGLGVTHATRFGVIALDEGIDGEERPPQALIERLAFEIDLTGIGMRDATDDGFAPAAIAAARAALTGIQTADRVIAGLCEAGSALGVGSVRAEILALATARAAAAVSGESAVTDAEAMLAARLVLLPRATRLPPPPESEVDAAQPPDAASAEAQDQDDDIPETPPDDPSQSDTPEPEPLGEILLEAIAAALPANLLALAARNAGPSRTRSEGRAGAHGAAARRGQVIGIRPGSPGDGGRLNLIETLRAAAPWQAVRAREAGAPAIGRIRIAAGDLRLSKFKTHMRTAIIFLVDASGSSALHRLAEAKGAVELLLADCYVRRDRVAVIAFRGTSADLILPPTHSLTRAKRALNGLPGGGATPLASAIDAGLDLALRVRRDGEQPLLVVLTDGQSNVGRDGRGGRPQAEADALQAARLIRAARLSAILIDTAQRPDARARGIAEAMGADYVALPQANAATMSRVMKAAVAASAA